MPDFVINPSDISFDGKNHKTNCYNFDAIIAMGYRVNSYQATQFCIWVTKTLGFIPRLAEGLETGLYDPN